MSAARVNAAAGAMCAGAAALIYGEHLYADAVDRSWAHYVADAVQAAGFWVLAAVMVMALVPRAKPWKRARAVMLAVCAWAGCECLLTVAAGIIGFGGAEVPEQWQGLLGRQLGLPMAACGLTSFAVLILSLWGADDET